MDIRRHFAMWIIIWPMLGMLAPAAGAADWKTLEAAKSNMMKDERFSSVLLDHDQDVLKTYAKQKDAFSVKGLTGLDAEHSLSDAWFQIRMSGKLAPNVGISYRTLASFFEENEPVVFDSAPRGAVVIISPTGEPARKTTRDTWNLKTGQTFKIHFSKAGYRDTPEETIMVTKDMPVICRELKPLDPSVKPEPCPKP